MSFDPYQLIHIIEMETTTAGAYAMALFPADNGIGGAIVVGEGSIPSEIGSLVYLNAGKDQPTYQAIHPKCA